MVNIEKIEKLKDFGLKNPKKRIVLCHTSREANEYLASLEFRYNGNFDKIPHFLIKKNGEIIQLMEEKSYSNFFTDEPFNSTSIIISLENLGWLEKKPLSNHYINWKGSIYIGEVHEKKWRDFFFWEPYSEDQVKSTAELCLQLTEILNIKKKCVGHNTKIDGVEHFEGIVSKSNFDGRFTDLNPSFNFESFNKLIQNG